MDEQDIQDFTKTRNLRSSILFILYIHVNFFSKYEFSADAGVGEDLVDE